MLGPGLGPILARILGLDVLVSLISTVLLGPVPAGIPTQWQTEPACVQAQAVPARVAGLLGGRPVPPDARLTLAAEQRGDTWRIAVELEQAAGTLRRTLEGRNCVTLTEAVALVVAVRLDAVAVAEAIEREALGEPPRVPEPNARESAPPSEPARSEPARASDRPAADPTPRPPGPSAPSALELSRSRPRALLSAAAAFELGALPRGAAAFELAGGVGWSRARVELGALTSMGPDGVGDRLATVGGRFRLFTGLLRGCGGPGRARIELPLCGGVELGDLRASGTGLRRPSTIDALWLAAVVSARPQWVPTPRLAVGGLLDLVVPLRRHRFATPEAGLVHEVAAVAVRLGLRVELRLP